MLWDGNGLARRVEAVRLLAPALPAADLSFALLVLVVLGKVHALPERRHERGIGVAVTTLSQVA